MNKRFNLITVVSLSLSLLLTSELKAGVGTEMENLFESMGGGANVTSGGAYKKQTGGYYTGGSVYARFPTRNYQLANFQPPSIKAGCGGIDIFAGSFSFIDAKQMIKGMRNVMTNALGYSFNLALQTFVPQVYNTMQKLNDIAREINNLNMNSCETASQIMGGVWAKSDIASKQLCQSMGTSNGKFGDWARARQDCGVGGKRAETNNDSEMKKKGFKHQLRDEFNIAWEAIKNQSLFGNATSDSQAKAVAEFFMSISGTLIGKKEGSGEETRIKIIHRESLATQTGLLDMLMFGKSDEKGDAKVYECKDKEKCLEVSKAGIKFNEKDALVPKIEEMLRKISQKMRDHDSNGLTAQEKSLIENTQIPIMKIISVQNAFMVGSSVINIHEYAEPIAYDYLLGYLEKILDFINSNLNQLSKVQMDDTQIVEFKNKIARVRKIITDERYGSYQRMIAAISVIEKSNLIEKKVEHMFSEYGEVASE